MPSSVGLAWATGDRLIADCDAVVANVEATMANWSVRMGYTGAVFRLPSEGGV